MSTLKVRYVGKKDRRADTVAGTGLVWEGHGDVQLATPQAWDKLRRHPDVWELVVDDDEQPEGLGLAQAKMPPADVSETFDLDAATDEAVHAYAKAKGLKVHHKVNGEKLRATVRELLED